MQARLSAKLSLSLVAGLAACGGAEPKDHVLRGPAFGTRYQVRWVGPLDDATVQSVIDAELARANALFNTWQPASQISRFNDHASTEPFEAAPPLAALVREALAITHACDGAYDVTVAPLLAVRGFGPKRYQVQNPTPEQVHAAQDLVGPDMLRVEGAMLIKQDPGVRIELSSTAKGWAVDRISEALLEVGAANHLVEIGGELVGRGRKRPDLPWTVAVESPPNAEADAVPLALEDRAIATSGSYRNFIESGHHIFDPRTGENPSHRVASVSVLAPDCASADALATALMVTGHRRGLDLLDAYPAAAALFLEVREDGSVRSLSVRWPE